MDKNAIYFSNEMKDCLEIIDKVIKLIPEDKERDKADYAIKYLLETANKGIEPIKLYSVKRGCPDDMRRIKTGIEII